MRKCGWRFAESLERCHWFYIWVRDSPTQIKTIQVFTRFSPRYVHPIEESNRYTVRRIAPPEQQEVLLGVAHVPSKLRFSDQSQVLECVKLAQMIQRAEQKEGHYRTVLVGDFNMNPFEAGVVGTGALNATMTRSRARMGARKVQGESYDFFYDPMWGHFGDRDDRPAGTYYYPHSEHVVYFWNMFDQVMVRPSLIERLDIDRIRIVDRIGSVSLLSKDGTPDQTVASDHLPLTFTLRL